MTTALDNLTAVETRRRAELEATIREHIDSFQRAGNALTEMRDNRLYRNTHETFDDYCRDCWGMGHSHAYRLIDAAQVVKNVSPIGDAPKNEAQARPLTQLPPDEQPSAWKEAVDTAPNGKVTAKHVETVVRRRKGEDEPSLVDTAPLRALSKAEAEEAERNGKPREWNGRPIPADAPPLDLDVSNEPGVRWAAMVAYFQRGISRLPDKKTLAELPPKKRKYIAERFRDFAKQIKEAV